MGWSRVTQLLSDWNEQTGHLVYEQVKYIRETYLLHDDDDMHLRAALIAAIFG